MKRWRRSGGVTVSSHLSSMILYSSSFVCSCYVLLCVCAFFIFYIERCVCAFVVFFVFVFVLHCSAIVCNVIGNFFIALQQLGVDFVWQLFKAYFDEQFLHGLKFPINSINTFPIKAQHQAKHIHKQSFLTCTHINTQTYTHTHH